MTMKLVKQTAKYSIYQRGDARYAVKDATKKPVNGEAKAQILLAEDLIKAVLPKKPAAEPAGEQESPAAIEAEAPADAE